MGGIGKEAGMNYYEIPKDSELESLLLSLCESFIEPYKFPDSSCHETT